MTPREALLEVDRARVSSKGVQGHHVVALRKSCACMVWAPSAAAIGSSGVRKTFMFRSWVGAAMTAVETGEGETTGWSSLGA